MFIASSQCHAKHTAAYGGACERSDATCTFISICMYYVYMYCIYMYRVFAHHIQAFVTIMAYVYLYTYFCLCMPLTIWPQFQAQIQATYIHIQMHPGNFTLNYALHNY